MEARVFDLCAAVRDRIDPRMRPKTTLTNRFTSISGAGQEGPDPATPRPSAAAFPLLRSGKATTRGHSGLI